ncbi:glucose-6-phosphatase catalytic subunit 1 [Leptidea sinapis]|uniref:glucose-6-phosphatase catalytic subunit 1 n=1 Tax=Leptidea sinapis TaxID=189913 RepID=UPI002127F9EB|nr:glucose-6-phosphatase catalytic subunit 1 [Leptidea sinapis]
MREHLYALGVSLIEIIQYWFVEWEPFFEQVNSFYNPGNVLEVLFPVVAFIDSVFASQLLLVTSFGGCLNGILKWWLLEDRPYWWVRETTYYTGTARPKLYQTAQTCETGPGCPSGHTATAASILILAIMWISHILNDRKWKFEYWKYLVYPIFASQMLSVMLARMYVATHFPHQCLLGALIGAFIAPALCLYVADPYIWHYGHYSTQTTSSSIKKHLIVALLTAAVCVLTYFGLMLSGIDPHATVKLAFRWCENPDSIHVSTTPLYALVQCSSTLIGWALFVSPAVAKYRHDTYNRSFILAAFSTILITYGFHYIDNIIPKDSVLKFYAFNSILSCLKPLLFLRVVPQVAMWPFRNKSK